MKPIWPVIIAFIPVMVFWIIIKILRVKLYLYQKKHDPKKYEKFGYQTMNLSYLGDILRIKGNDPEFIRLAKLNRLALIIFTVIIIITGYIIFLYLR